MCNSLPALRFSDLGGLERTSTGRILWAGMNAVRLEIKKKDRASEFHYLFSHSLGALVFLVSCHCSADVLQWLPSALCTKIKRRSAAAWPASTSGCSAAHRHHAPCPGAEHTAASAAAGWPLQALRFCPEVSSWLLCHLFILHSQPSIFSQGRLFCRPGASPASSVAH